MKPSAAHDRPAQPIGRSCDDRMSRRGVAAVENAQQRKPGAVVSKGKPLALLVPRYFSTLPPSRPTRNAGSSPMGKHEPLPPPSARNRASIYADSIGAW